jgi:uncharacterized membrane protein HdeD (DUF308 family)
MSQSANPAAADLFAARQASKASIAFGALLSVLGIFAVLSPMFSGIAVTVLVGMLLLAAGFVELIFAFQADSFGKGVLRFLFGGLTLLAGAIIVATPGPSLGALTIVLAVFFVIGGVTDIVLAFKVRPEDGWGWALFSGVASILLGIFIVSQWPVSGIWAVGIYVGVRILMHGWMLMSLGRTGQETLTHLQDTRVDMLEYHLRAGAKGLQQTQAALADHTAMLLALDNELRKKVSTSDLDPSIQELSEKLGAARKWMDRAAESTTEAWASTQKEANAAFEKLQHSVADMTARLKKDLGLGGPGQSPKGA